MELRLGPLAALRRRKPEAVQRSAPSKRTHDCRQGAVSFPRARRLPDQGKPQQPKNGTLICRMKRIFADRLDETSRLHTARPKEPGKSGSDGCSAKRVSFGNWITQGMLMWCSTGFAGRAPAT
jgi:hypothetical protein